MAEHLEQGLPEDQWQSRGWSDFLALVEATPSDAAKPPTAAEQQNIDTFNDKQVVDSIQLDVLGKVGYGKVKVFSRYHRQVEIIGGVSKMKLEELLEVAGPPARAVYETSGGGTLPPGTYTLRDVRRAISTLAGFHKITDETELGPGCWAGRDESGGEHPSVLIVGNREAADWNGSKKLVKIDHPRCRGHLLDFGTASPPWYSYNQLALYMEMAKDRQFREQAMNDAIQMFSRWRWKNEVSSPIVLAGLVFATWVQTLWEWRPQVSIIGKSNSGKSMLVKAISGLFGNLCKTCSDSTEAGIRQVIENSARVILFDEFDAEDKKQAEEQQKILKMLRASGRGDAIFRGTSNQKGREFTLYHIVWLAGIQIASPREADRNRYITLELIPPREEMKGKLTLPPAGELRDLGQRMLATAIYCIHDAKKVAVNLKDTRISGVNDRIIESYAVPAAILAAVQGDNEEAARELLREMLAEIAVEDQGGQSDEQTLMADILGAPVQIGSYRYSVAQLVEIVMKQDSNWETAETALESRGLKLDRMQNDGSRCLLMAHNMISEHLIKTTKWGSQAIDQILKRIPTAHPSRRRVGGQRVRTVSLSLEYVKSEFLGIEQGDIPEIIPSGNF